MSESEALERPSPPGRPAARPVILQVISRLDPDDGGPAAGSVELNAELRRLGADAHLVTTTDGHGGPELPPAARARPRERGAAVWWSKPSRPAALRLSWGLVRTVWVESRRADLVVIHGQYLPANVAAYAAARLRRVPYDVFTHGTLDPRQRARSRGRKAVYNLLVGRSILRQADRILFTSTAEQEGAADLVPAPRSCIVPLGVALGEPVAVPAIERRLTGVPRERTVLFLGRLAPVKRPLQLLEAWAAARDGRARALVIAGPEYGVTRSELAARAAELGVADEVVLLGAADLGTKSWLYQRSGVFVLASEHENFAITVAEAMASGCAVVVSPQVAASELVAESGGGWVLEDYETATVGRALAAALEDPEAVRARGGRALDFARTRISWRPAAQTLLDQARRTEAAWSASRS